MTTFQKYLQFSQQLIKDTKINSNTTLNGLPSKCSRYSVYPTTQTSLIDTFTYTHENPTIHFSKNMYAFFRSYYSDYMDLSPTLDNIDESLWTSKLNNIQTSFDGTSKELPISKCIELANTFAATYRKPIKEYTKFLYDKTLSHIKVEDITDSKETISKETIYIYVVFMLASRVMDITKYSKFPQAVNSFTEYSYSGNTIRGYHYHPIEAHNQMSLLLMSVLLTGSMNKFDNI